MMEEDLLPEMAVLGVGLIRTSAFRDIAGMLQAEDFYKPAHGTLFNAMTSLTKRGVNIDIITLEDEMHAHGHRLQLEGGVGPYAVQCANAAITAENAPHYANIVAKRSARRRLKALLQEMDKLADEGEFAEGQRRMIEQQKLWTEAERGRINPGIDVASLVEPALVAYEARMKAYAEGRPKIIGTSTGITALDNLTHGLQSEKLVVVGARPGVGKTAFVCQLALIGAIHDDVPAIIFSLEMPPPELVDRFFARMGKVNSARLLLGNITYNPEYKRLYAAGQQMSKKGMLTISNSRTLTQIETEARAFRIQHPHQRILVVVDYLQLVEAGTVRRGGNREQDIGVISRALKALAMELKCPVVTPSQFNRDPEKENRDPELKDLRESGSIEQDSDVIMAICRRREAGAKDAVIKVLKQRNGATGDALVEWNPENYEFKDAEDYYPPPRIVSDGYD